MRAHQDGQEHGEAEDPPETHVVVGAPAPAEEREGDHGAASVSGWLLELGTGPGTALLARGQQSGASAGLSHGFLYNISHTYPPCPTHPWHELILTGCFHRETSQQPMG